MKTRLSIVMVAVVALIVGVLGESVSASTADTTVAKAAKKKQKCKGKRKRNKKGKCVAIKDGKPGNPGNPGAPGDPGDPGDPGAAKVTELPSSGFAATNPTVSMTPDGIEFGPYADGGAAGGSVYFSALNGATLNDVESLIYTARFTSDTDTGGVGVPYLSIFLEGDTVDAIFSPNTQPDADIDEGEFNEWVATSGVWRYDDDCGDGFLDSTSTDGSGCTGTGTPSPYGVNGAPYSQIQADHGTEVVSGIYLSTGFTAGTNLAALLREWEINETTYQFGS